jgi:hypothetical protein
MLRALLARLRMWLDHLLGLVRSRGQRTRPCPACKRPIPTGALKCPYCATWLGWP